MSSGKTQARFRVGVALVAIMVILSGCAGLTGDSTDTATPTDESQTQAVGTTASTEGSQQDSTGTEEPQERALSERNVDSLSEVENYESVQSTDVTITDLTDISNIADYHKQIFVRNGTTDAQNPIVIQSTLVETTSTSEPTDVAGSLLAEYTGEDASNQITRSGITTVYYTTPAGYQATISIGVHEGTVAYTVAVGSQGDYTTITESVTERLLKNLE